MKSIKIIFTIFLTLLFLNQADSQVTQEWAAIYNGSANTNDVGFDIITDGFGNVIVTGRSGLSNPTANFRTIKYSSAGVEQWNAVYNGPSNNFESAIGLVADAAGNIYVTGVSYNPLTDHDIVLVKYSAAGIEQWVRTWSNAGSLYDRPNDIKIDASGNIYIAGHSEIPPSVNYITLKYNSGGVLLWAKQFNDGVAYGIEVDASGNAYVTGHVESSTSSDFLTIKYNSVGDTLWVRRYGSANFDESPKAIALDINGNCYVTGAGTTLGFLTVKYNSSGVQQWVASNDSVDTPSDVEVDALGNVYVTGITYVGSSINFATIKFNSSGVRQWISIYDYLKESLGDYAFDLELDAAGNVYVTGNSETEGEINSDILTVKYNNAGAEEWVARYDEANNEGVFALALDAAGNVYVTGQRTLTVNSDFLTIKYSQTVGINQISSEIPDGFSLSQNYPNPFNPVTHLEFGLPAESSAQAGISNLKFVSLKVYDVNGREVATLVNERLQPGSYEVEFNGSNFTSGVYFYRIITEQYIETKKMIFTK